MKIRGVYKDMLTSASERGTECLDRVIPAAECTTTRHTVFIRNQSIRTLSRSGYGALTKISVEVTENKIVLTGMLPSYFLKQMAQRLIQPFLEDRRLVNNCSVIDDGE